MPEELRPSIEFALRAADLLPGGTDVAKLLRRARGHPAFRRRHSYFLPLKCRFALAPIAIHHTEEPCSKPRRGSLAFGSAIRRPILIGR